MEPDTIQAKLHARMPCGDDKEYRDVRRPAPEETARPVCRDMEKEGGSRVRWRLRGQGPPITSLSLLFNFAGRDRMEMEASKLYARNIIIMNHLLSHGVMKDRTQTVDVRCSKCTVI